MKKGNEVLQQYTDFCDVATHTLHDKPQQRFHILRFDYTINIAFSFIRNQYVKYKINCLSYHLSHPEARPHPFHSFIIPTYSLKSLLAVERGSTV